MDRKRKPEYTALEMTHMLRGILEEILEKAYFEQGGMKLKRKILRQRVRRFLRGLRRVYKGDEQAVNVIKGEQTEWRRF